jgi:hypothetical protein
VTGSSRFDAPWGKLLMVFTFIGCAALIGVPIAIWLGEAPPFFFGLMGLVFAAILIVCALCAVRGYRLEGDTLLIERVG